MNSHRFDRPTLAATCSHELLFASLYEQGRGISIPCDETGKVDIDALSQRMRTTYLGARAMIGREYAYPTVRIVRIVQ